MLSFLDSEFSDTREVETDVHHFNRAFADFIFGSMILHFFCVNFIN